MADLFQVLTQRGMPVGTASQIATEVRTRLKHDRFPDRLFQPGEMAALAAVTERDVQMARANWNEDPGPLEYTRLLDAGER